MSADNEKFQTKKSLGQHFLTSDIVPGWMCDAAKLEAGELVLEVGPGTGVLTKELLKRGVRVIALEADPRAIAVLEETFTHELNKGQLQLIHQDVRTLDVAQLSELTDHGYKVVANIPYYLSGRLFRIFLESAKQPKSLVFLVQKEVAKRITTDTSRGEKESLLSISVKIYGKPTYVRTVTRGHFTPPPKVDSGIILIDNISRERFDHIDEEIFFTVLHLAFGKKRKQLLGNLAGEYTRELVSHTLSTLQLPLSTRAEDVPPEKWPTLVSKLISTHN